MKFLVIVTLLFSQQTLAGNILDTLLDPSQRPTSVPSVSYESGLCLTSEEKVSLVDFVKSKSLKVNGILLRQPVLYCESYDFIHPRFMKKIESGSRYANEAGSLYDCDKYRAGAAKMAVMNQYHDELVSFADKVNTMTSAKCLFSLYNQMALEGSYLKGDGVRQSDFVRLWTVGSMAALLIKKYPLISNFGFFDSRKSGMIRIRKWMEELGQLVYLDSINTREKKNFDPHDIYEPTNMQISRSFALLTSSILSQNSAHLKESKRIFKEGILAITNADYALYRSAQDKGYLISEMRRGRRAQAYHAISLATLLAIRSFYRAANCSFHVNVNGKSVIPSRLAFLYRKTAEGGIYRDSAGKVIHRNSNVFPDHLKLMSESHEIELFKLKPVEYIHAQSDPQNVDAFLPLLPGQSVNSTDYQIKSLINSYLKFQGYAPLQGNQGISMTYRRKLGGDLRTYPAYLTLAKTSVNLLSNEDSGDDFKALLQPGFCE